MKVTFTLFYIELEANEKVLVENVKYDKFKVHKDDRMYIMTKSSAEISPMLEFVNVF